MLIKSSVAAEHQGQGQDVVFLHGWGLNSGVWGPLEHALSHHCRITLIDLPGHGRNRDYFPGDYDFEEVCELVAQQVPENATLVAWSLGGLIAQRLAILYPGKVRRLLLVATTPKFMGDDNWHGIDPAVLIAFEQQLQRDHHKTLGRFLAIQAMGSPSAKRDTKLLQQLISDQGQPAPEALAGGLRLLREVDLRRQVKSIEASTHRLYGRLDSLVPEKAHDAIATLHEDASQHVFAKSSHAPFISHRQDFVEKVLHILQSPIT